MAKETEVYIGRRLREARLSRGLSQTALGKRVGVTFQQIQKYEKGANRIGGSRMWDLSCILGVPVSFFFEGLSCSEKYVAVPVKEVLSPLTRHSIQLAKDIDSIRDEPLKLHVIRLVKSLADPRLTNSSRV